MKFKEIVRTTEQVIEREFDGSVDEIVELFEYLVDGNVCGEFEFNTDRWV